MLVAGSAHGQGKRQISEDRDLKEIDLNAWNCLNRPEGSARTPDGMERNRLKNRTPVDISTLKLEELDTAKFLQGVAKFEAQTKGMRRKDLNEAQRQMLEPLEKQMVAVTGYLVLAYCGPPETTNCASVDFHDWHLEVFEKPSDHPPQPGDPTPIICEITPRTQNAIFHDNIRIQELTAFFRRPDLIYEPTGHKARKVKVIGYRLWDDEHNGRADVGPTIRTVGANKFHNPWRSAAWEVHPVLKIIPMGDGAGKVAPAPSVPPAEIASTPSPVQTSPPSATTPLPTAARMAALTTPSSPPAPAAPARPQFATLTQSVKIRIPYGETVLPRGTKLLVTSLDDRSVTVQYMGGSYVIPIGSTDLR